MNHKKDKYYLAVGLLLPSAVNIARLQFGVKIPHWLSLILIIMGIVALAIYVARYWKANCSPETHNKESEI